MLGNGPSLNMSGLPKKNVIICNHFWRHSHYNEIENGFHIISDTNFLKAEDLNIFIKNINKSICIVCSTEVRKELIKCNVTATIMCINYSGSRPIWRNGVTEKDIKRRCQTGSTVIVDIGLPLVRALGVKKIRVLGVDFDYGSNLRSYAFDVTKSILAPDWYMERYWKKRALVSFDTWTEALETEGFQIIRCVV